MTPPKFKPSQRVRLGETYRYGTVEGKPVEVTGEWCYQIRDDTRAANGMWRESNIRAVHVKIPSLVETFKVAVQIVSGELKQIKVDALNTTHAIAKAANKAQKQQWKVQQITVEK